LQYRDEHGERRMPDIFKAGDKVPTTGVYKTVHALQHAPPHYVTAIYGNVFPTCVECSDNVRFEIALFAVHVNAHPLFMQ